MTKKTFTNFKDTEIGSIPGEWGISIVGEYFDVKNGKTNTVDAIKDGIFPLFDRSTEIKSSNKYLFDSEAVIVPGEGAVFIPRFYKGKFDLHQRAYAITPKNDRNIISTKFLFYWILTHKDWLSRVAVGSTVKSLRLGMLTDFPLVVIPDINEQEKIAEMFYLLDEKIKLNLTINANLEKLASSLFKKWFYEANKDELPKNWRIGTFGEAIENFDSKRVPLSSRERERRAGHYPYYGATSIVDYVDDYIFDGTYVLLGEDGSVVKENGKPFTQYVSGKIWVNNHAHVLQGKNGFSTEYVKVFLDQVEINQFVTGAVQPKLNQANMNSIPMIIPDEETLRQFNKTLVVLFEMILENEKQIRNLEQIRDFLLPRVMSGKIRI